MSALVEIIWHHSTLLWLDSASAWSQFIKKNTVKATRLLSIIIRVRDCCQYTFKQALTSKNAQCCGMVYTIFLSPAFAWDKCRVQTVICANLIHWEAINTWCGNVPLFWGRVSKLLSEFMIRSCHTIQLCCFSMMILDASCCWEVIQCSRPKTFSPKMAAPSWS